MRYLLFNLRALHPFLNVFDDANKGSQPPHPSLARKGSSNRKSERVLSKCRGVIMSRLPRIRSEAADGSSLKKAVSGLRVVLCVSRIDCTEMDFNSMSLITARACFQSERGRQTRWRDCSLFFLSPSIQLFLATALSH